MSSTDDFVDFTITQPGYSATKGRYLATRRRDGWLYVETRGGVSKGRKFIDPKYVSNDRGGYEIRYIDKAYEV